MNKFTFEKRAMALSLIKEGYSNSEANRLIKEKYGTALAPNTYTYLRQEAGLSKQTMNTDINSGIYRDLLSRLYEMMGNKMDFTAVPTKEDMELIKKVVEVLE